jgi:hypothetical protein
MELPASARVACGDRATRPCAHCAARVLPPRAPVQTACPGALQVKARGPPAPEDGSVAAHLLRLRDPATGAPLPDAALAGEFGVFFTAGIESAGHAITWTLCAP